MNDKLDWAEITAAQMWCEERFSDRVMDAEFCAHIAKALRKAKAEGVLQVMEMLLGAKLLVNNPKELLNHMADKIERGEA